MEEFKRRINNQMQDKSKMKYYMDGKKHWEPQKPAEYMNKLNRNQVSCIFKARTRMLNVKSNFKNGHQEHKCRACKQKEETQTHVLEECHKLNDKHQKITKEMIFSENIEELRKTAKAIQERIEKLEETQGTNTD